MIVEVRVGAKDLVPCTRDPVSAEIGERGDVSRMDRLVTINYRSPTVKEALCICMAVRLTIVMRLSGSSSSSVDRTALSLVTPTHATLVARRASVLAAGVRLGCTVPTVSGLFIGLDRFLTSLDTVVWFTGQLQLAQLLLIVHLPTS